MVEKNAEMDITTSTSTTAARVAWSGRGGNSVLVHGTVGEDACNLKAGCGCLSGAWSGPVDRLVSCEGCGGLVIRVR